MKIPNYLAWAAIIVIADKLGVKSSLLELSKTVVETGKAPEVVFSKELENQAIEANSVVVHLGLLDRANEMADEVLIKYL